MITPMMIYWITRLDYIRGLVLLLAVMFGVGLFIACFLQLMTIEEETDVVLHNAAKRKAKGFLIFFVVSTLLFQLTPSTKEMCAIITLPAIANSKAVEELNGLGCDIIDMARDYIKDVMESKKEERRR